MNQFILSFILLTSSLFAAEYDCDPKTFKGKSAQEMIQELSRTQKTQKNPLIDPIGIERGKVYSQSEVLDETHGDNSCEGTTRVVRKTICTENATAPLNAYCQVSCEKQWQGEDCR